MLEYTRAQLLTFSLSMLIYTHILDAFTQSQNAANFPPKVKVLSFQV